MSNAENGREEMGEVILCTMRRWSLRGEEGDYATRARDDDSEVYLLRSLIC